MAVCKALNVKAVVEGRIAFLEKQAAHLQTALLKAEEQLRLLVQDKAAMQRELAGWRMTKVSLNAYELLQRCASFFPVSVAAAGAAAANSAAAAASAHAAAAAAAAGRWHRRAVRPGKMHTVSMH